MMNHRHSRLAGGLHHQDGGWPSSPGAVGNRVVLGSSFPSGHTLFVAAFGIAAALCISRIWPAAREFALSISILWLGDIGCIW